MHSYPLEDNEDAFYLRGVASHVTDPDVRERLGRQFADERARFAIGPPGEEQHLFAFAVELAMITRTTGHGDPEPKHTVWRAT
jgi:hypothetical protein